METDEGEESPGLHRAGCQVTPGGVSLRQVQQRRPPMAYRYMTFSTGKGERLRAHRTASSRCRVNSTRSKTK